MWSRCRFIPFDATDILHPTGRGRDGHTHHCCSCRPSAYRNHCRLINGKSQHDEECRREALTASYFTSLSKNPSVFAFSRRVRTFDRSILSTPPACPPLTHSPRNGLPSFFRLWPGAATAVVRTPTTPKQKLPLTPRAAPRAGAADRLSPRLDDEVFEMHGAL